MSWIIPWSWGSTVAGTSWSLASLVSPTDDVVLRCIGADFVSRLHSYLHMGQKVGELGKRIGILRWRWQGRTHNCYAKTIQTTILQRHGALFPFGMFYFTHPADLPAEVDLQIPDRWMQQRDTHEED